VRRIRSPLAGQAEPPAAFGWPRASLSAVAAIERKAIKPSEIVGHELYVGLENLDSSGKFLGVRASADAGLKSNKFAFTEDHVLYGKLRPYLAKIAAPDFGGICSTDIIPIRPGDRLDRRYLLHFLRTPAMVAHAAHKSVGINLPRLSPNVLESFEVPLPPIEEQRRIAAVLDAAEALRAKRRQALSKLDQLDRSIFQSCLSEDKVESVELGRLVDPVAKWNPRRDGSGTFIYIDITSIDQVMKVVAQPTTIDASEAPSRARQLVSSRDILVSTVRPNLNAVACVRPNLDGATASTGFCVLRPRRDELDWRYLFQYVKSQHFVRQLLQVATGASYPAVSDRIVKATEVPLLAIAKQRRLGDLLDVSELLRAKHQTALAVQDELFASLQQRAFRGEL